MQKWEYKIIRKNYGQESSDGKVRNKLSNRGLNELGQEGWELVAGVKGRLYFKRPLD
tara:strand:- start:412 stop:582 length:171 start_codon:yes stop_codon:yes gene_type:complete